MRVALTGASGFIGSVIARHLADAGDQVTGLLRPTSRKDHVSDCLDRVVLGAQDEHSTFDDLLEGADVLVHNSVDWKILRDGDIRGHLESNLVASIELIDMVARRGMRLVYLSSVAVHHHMLDRWQGDIDDEHPMRPGTLYGALKSSIENHLWAAHADHGLSFASLRPSAVYGIDPRLERSIGYPILQGVAKGEAQDRKGGGKFVHVDDVAATVVSATRKQSAEPGIYHLADCYARWADWARLSCDVLKAEVDIDCTSPTQPRNQFNHDLLEEDLGITLERGTDGIRDHLRELAGVMQDAGVL